MIHLWYFGAFVEWRRNLSDSGTHSTAYFLGHLHFQVVSVALKPNLFFYPRGLVELLVSVVINEQFVEHLIPG